MQTQLTIVQQQTSYEQDVQQLTENHQHRSTKNGLLSAVHSNNEAMMGRGLMKSSKQMSIVQIGQASESFLAHSRFRKRPARSAVRKSANIGKLLKEDQPHFVSVVGQKAPQIHWNCFDNKDILAAKSGSSPLKLSDKLQNPHQTNMTFHIKGAEPSQEEGLTPHNVEALNKIMF